VLSNELSPASQLPASIAITPTGATVHVELPRKLSGRSWQLWIRFGEPGGPPPRGLNLKLQKEGRQIKIKSATKEKQAETTGKGGDATGRPA
jgi:hypothetical protein